MIISNVRQCKAMHEPIHCESSIPGSSGESIIFIFAVTATCCLHVHVKDCKVTQFDTLVAKSGPWTVLLFGWVLPILDVSFATRPAFPFGGVISFISGCSKKTAAKVT